MDDEGFLVGSGHVVASTNLALRVQIVGGDVVWVPKSVIHDDSEIFDALNNAKGKLIVEAWFAAKEGWLE